MPTTTAIPKAGGTLNADTAATANSLAQRDAAGYLVAVGFSGGVAALAAATYSANTSGTLAETFITMDATAGVRTYTLPPAASVAGQSRVIKKIDSSGNNVVVAAQAGETIDGAASKTLSTQYAKTEVWSDGSTWWVRV